MRIPACVPRLPPGLLSAWALDYCTRRWVVKKRKKKAQKARAKSPDGLAGKVKVFLFTPGDIPKYDCKICITSGKRRAIIELMPGKTSKHDPIPARQLARAIHKHCHGSWPHLPFRRYRTFKYIAALVRNMGERGLIHNLTEDPDQYNKLCWFAFRHRWCVPPGIYPFPELRLSNFAIGDIYLSMPGDGLPIEPGIKLKSEAEMTWGKEVFIERPVKRPGVVRICPVLHHKDNVVQRPRNNSANTKFHFGKTIQTGDVSLPIAVDILEFAGQSHMYGVGQTGCGKTNLWKGLCQDATDMMENGIVSNAWFFDPVKKANGLGQFKSERFRFATTPEQIITEVNEIQSDIAFRNNRLSVINKERELRGQSQLTQWPLGQTFALRNQQPELYTAKLILVDEIQGFTKDFIEQTFVPWAQQLRSLGFVLILFGQDFRANVNIPTALLKNIDARMCMRVRDETIGYDFFKAGKEYRWSREPTKLKRGEFVIDLPWRGLDLQYGITKHIPDEDAQAA